MFYLNILWIFSTNLLLNQLIYSTYIPEGIDTSHRDKIKYQKVFNGSSGHGIVYDSKE
jgi:hypothetical protein